MRILDENNVELGSVDETLGTLEEETIVIARHEAVEAVEEQWHYEVVREYENGGKDVERVIDVPGVEAREAYEETETILRWRPYSAEYLEEQRLAEEAAKAEAQRQAQEMQEVLEAAEHENRQLRARVSALMENQQFLEDCLAEMAEIVYA